MEVYFEGGFRGRSCGEYLCKRTGVTREFQWNGHDWRLLALYVCEKGAVLDFAKRVPVEEIRRFDEKWLEKIHDKENGLLDFPEENMEYENPFAEQLQMEAWINQEEVVSMSGCSCVYRPEGCRGESSGAVCREAADAALACDGTGTEAAVTAETAPGTEWVEHYGLSRECGWYLERKTLKRPELWERQHTGPEFAVEGLENPAELSGTDMEKGALRLVLKPERLQLQCEQTFETISGEKGKEVTFSHPVKGSSHVLIVEAVTEEELLKQSLMVEGKEYRIPTHLQCLHYSFRNSKDLEGFTVRDLGQGDAPVCMEEEQQKQGATSIFLCGNFRKAEGEEAKREGRRIQASRAYFHPVKRVCWGIMAIVLRGEELVLELEWPECEEDEIS